MRMRLCLIAAFFALAATMATAMELQNHPVDGRRSEADLGMPRHHDFGWMDIENRDWVPYVLSIFPEDFRVIMHDEKSGVTDGYRLEPGDTVRIYSPRHIWQIYGRTGRSLDVGVHNHRGTPVRFVPVGDSRLIGMEGIVYDGGRDRGELLYEPERRPMEGWPSQPAPEPYSPPHYSDPWGWGHNQPPPPPEPPIGSGAQPYFGGPSIQEPPRHQGFNPYLIHR